MSSNALTGMTWIPIQCLYLEGVTNLTLCSNALTGMTWIPMDAEFCATRQRNIK